MQSANTLSGYFKYLINIFIEHQPIRLFANLLDFRSTSPLSFSPWTDTPWNAGAFPAGCSTRPTACCAASAASSPASWACSSCWCMLNVVTRYSGVPLYWVDEASVYCVVWLTFIGASAMTRLRLDFAVTLLHRQARRQKAARIAKASGLGRRAAARPGAARDVLDLHGPGGPRALRLRCQGIRRGVLQLSLHRAHADAELADLGHPAHPADLLARPSACMRCPTSSKTSACSPSAVHAEFNM
jgi:hypothetical protein